MGKASSNKKVARAAGTGGGRSYRARTPWGYFVVVGLIVILGIAGTITSRNHRLSQIATAGKNPPTVGTQWYEGYGVYICGKFLPAIATGKTAGGIGTYSTKGVITIDPTTNSSAGKNATLGKFASAVGMTLNAAEIKVPGGKAYQDSASCEGKAGHVYIKEFSFVGDTAGAIYNGAKDQLPKTPPEKVLLKDAHLLTIAFVPSSKESSIPPPPAYVGTNLTAAENAKSSSSSTSPTLAPPATAPPSSSATTAPGATAPATTAATTAKS